jgi:chondroitin AC lyase
MKMKKAGLAIVICFAFFSFSLAQHDITVLRKHLTDDALQHHGFTLRTQVYTPFQLSEAGHYLASLKPNGSWADVDYGDRDNDWSPLVHLNRVLTMAVSYEKASSALYQEKKVLEGIERAMRYWYTVNPVCDNWFKNTNAKQFYLNVVGLLLQGKIDPMLQASIVNDLIGKPSKTGANRTLEAISTLYRGVLENNPERIRAGVDGVTDQIAVTVKEGIQPDYSFHQHGPFIYNGNYGEHFLRESVWLAAMVSGTSFAYKPEQLAILRDYYLKGTRWMIRGGLVDYNVCGRKVGRYDGFGLGGDRLVQQLELFTVADPPNKETYEVSKRHIQNQTPQDIRGNKHFWRSDYTAHHRPAYFTSLKMCSSRTTGIELNINSENLLGYWLPYGFTYIYRRGNEYQGVFPVWDWARLPGVTSPHVEIPAPAKSGGHTQQTTFVGGVSNGAFGVSAMEFAKEQTTARKAWFWFDTEWVALGAGIQSEHTAPIVTGVNQAMLLGPVWVNGKPFVQKEQALQNPRWVLHDSVGYVFPGKQTVNLKADLQSGNMRRIFGLAKDTVYTSEVFSLWFDHGTRPSAQSYAYIVVPGTSVASLDLFTKKMPIQVLSNTAAVQAVSHKALSLTGLVFYQAGSFAVRSDLSVAVDQPVLVLLDEQKGALSVSDPTGQLKQVEITLKMKNGKAQTKSIALPANEFAGKSVTVPLGAYN